MGRFINTALGQRWTDEPHPNEPGHLQYPPRTLHALGRMDAKMDVLVMEVGATAPAFPTDLDIEEVGKLLVEGRMWLPRYARVTVTTEVEEIKDKIFGTSTVFTHTADQLCCHQLRPMSIRAALEADLLVRRNGSWLWSEVTYRRLVPPDPRLRT
jgi:hypothetical protein